MSAWWPGVSLHVEGPATGQLDREFPRFSSAPRADAELIPIFPRCAACFTCRSNLNITNLSLISEEPRSRSVSSRCWCWFLSGILRLSMLAVFPTLPTSTGCKHPTSNLRGMFHAECGSWSLSLRGFMQPFCLFILLRAKYAYRLARGAIFSDIELSVSRISRSE